MDQIWTLQVAQRGLLTLPKALRDQYGLKPGDVLTLIDLDGAFVLSPRQSEIDLLADSISATLMDEGESLEGALASLRKRAKNHDANA